MKVRGLRNVQRLFPSKETVPSFLPYPRKGLPPAPHLDRTFSVALEIPGGTSPLTPDRLPRQAAVDKGETWPVGWSGA